MTDPHSILSALQSLKAASDIVKGFRLAEASYERAELKLKVAELAELLADARLNVLDAQEEIGRLQARIAELEAAPDLRKRLAKRGGVYYVIGESGEEESGPYCVRCFEVSQKLMPLTKVPVSRAHLGYWQCLECKAYF